jgi:hypothetical protein
MNREGFAMKGMEKRKKVSFGAKAWLAALAVALAFSAARPAAAACETAGAAGAAIGSVSAGGSDYISRFVTQEKSFEENIMRTAFKQLVNYYTKFGENILDALTNWAAKNWKGSLQSMTRALHVSQVDQTYRLGQMMDAQLMVEESSRMAGHLIDAYRRYAPSELACQIDSVGSGQSRAYQMSRALNRALAMDYAPRFSNAVGTPSANGRGSDVESVWREYVNYFCDYTMGDQGCAAVAPPATPPPLAGRQKDLGGLLWGPKMTIDLSNLDNLTAIKALLRYTVNPLASDPVPAKVVNTPAGRHAILARRADLAYANTIYNTLGAMLSERVGGSNVDVRQMRAAAGVPTADASANASYYEIQQAMTRDRFTSPDYLVHLQGSSPQVLREQATLNALRLQVMNDTFRRLEERLFMESAGYGRELNSQIPRAASPDIPLVHD